MTEAGNCNCISECGIKQLVITLITKVKGEKVFYKD